MPMGQSTFTHQYRLLICANCGASLSVPEEGGATACRYCGASSVYRPRTEIHDIAALRGAPAADEYDRYQKLKAQESKLLLPPPGLEPLMVAGSLPVQLLPQAQAQWQALVREVQAGAPMGAHERLYFLTFALAQALTRQGGVENEARRRGVIETAIECLSAPQHRHQLRATLARDAVRHGDLASAASWLAGCDSRSYDIEVDSEYRLAASFLATARQDWPGVLALLGQRPGDVPVASSTRRVLTMLRANALERTGRLPEAVEQLRALLGEEHLDDLMHIQKVNMPVELCSASLGALIAEKNSRDTGSAPADAPKKRGFGSPIAIPFVLAGLGMIVGGFFVDPKARTDDDMMQLNYFLWMLGGFFFLSGASSGLLLGKLNASVGVLGAASTAGWKRASGRIVTVQSTGWTINDQPQLALRLEIFYESLPIYEVDTKVCVPPHQVSELKPGVALVVRVDPANPQNVAVAGA